jgi:hypothetical protein
MHVSRYSLKLTIIQSLRCFFQQMGFSYSIDDYGDDFGKMCFNPAKSFQLGWYDSRVITIDPRSTPIWSGTIVGIADFEKDDRPVVIKIETGLSRDYFIGFNRATGINSQNVQADDWVTIIEADQDGVGYSQSSLLATMAQGGFYTWTNWEGTGFDLIVQVNGINLTATNSGPSGYADITIFLAAPPIVTTDVCTVFVTEPVFDGNFLDNGLKTANPIVNANQECQNRANDAGLEGEYKAWLSTGRTDFDKAGYSPKRAFVQCGSYVLPGGDGPSVADDGFPDLTDGTIDNPINELANGARIITDADFVWTGTFFDGSISSLDGSSSLLTCGDWGTSNGNGGIVGSILLENVIDGRWSARFTTSSEQCAFLARIYCFEQGEPPAPPTTDDCTVFVTEPVFDGNFLDNGLKDANPIVNANQECQNIASDAGLEGEYKAWLSTGPTDFDNTGYSPDRAFVKCGSYVLPGGDGPAVANGGFPDLTDGTVDNPINELANGVRVSYAESVLVWTGTFEDGSPTTLTCSDWGSNDGNGGTLGNTLGFRGWSRQFEANAAQCAILARMYCFEQGNPPLPPPPPTPPTTDVCTVFVTETVFNGNFLDNGLKDANPIVNANQECQNRANDAGLEGEYKAWLSTGPTDFDAAGYSPKSAFVQCGSYVLPGGDGPAVANDGFPDLTDGTIDNPINELANGVLVSGEQFVWTGTFEDGSPTLLTCSDWGTDVGNGGIIGSTLLANANGWSAFFESTSAQCAFLARIYCFEQGGLSNRRNGGGANGDPHFQTWNGGHFDYHGECDLVLLHSSEFGSGLGVDVHIRTKLRRDMAYISSAVLRIGTYVLEVESQGVYYLNGVLNAALPDEFSGFAFSHTQPTDKQHLFEVHLGRGEKINVKTYKDFVSVLIEQGKSENFHDSVGLMGDFAMGRMVARDGKTVIDDANAFGQEWQVLHTEPSLFQTVRFPQHPNVCTMPTPVQTSQLRRRLSELSSVDKAAAEKACAHWGEGKDDCIFDVLTTGDLEMAVVGAY